MEKNSVTMQFLEFSRDLVLKILPETYYEEGMVPEATGQGLPGTPFLACPAVQVVDQLRKGHIV